MFTLGVVLTFKGVGLHCDYSEFHISLLLLSLVMLETDWRYCL